MITIPVSQETLDRVYQELTPVERVKDRAPLHNLVLMERFKLVVEAPPNQPGDKIGPLTKDQWEIMRPDPGDPIVCPTVKEYRAMWLTLDALFAYRARTKGMAVGTLHFVENVPVVTTHPVRFTNEIAKELGLE